MCLTFFLNILLTLKPIHIYDYSADIWSDIFRLLLNTYCCFLFPLSNSKPNCILRRCGRANKAPIPAGHKGPFPKTDYMSTFEAVKNPRPRSSKKPPQTARDPRPLPMFLTTNQKDDFKDLGHVPRVQPIKQVNLLNKSSHKCFNVEFTWLLLWLWHVSIFFNVLFPQKLWTIWRISRLS